MVDKVYAMLHTLKFKREYNIKKAWDDFYKSHPKIVEEIDKNYGEKFDELLMKCLKVVKHIMIT